MGGDTIEFGIMAELRGFGVVYLRRPATATDAELRAAVERAENWAQRTGKYGLIVSVPGSGSFLSGTKFEVSKPKGRFNPRFVNLKTGELFRLPHFGKTRYVHNGSFWLRENRKKRMKHVLGPWFPLGFALDLDVVLETVYVRPAPDILVNGELIDKTVEIVENDTVSHNGAVLTYYAEPPGRPMLANFYARYTGMGWEQPGFTRAARVFTSS